MPPFRRTTHASVRDRLAPAPVDTLWPAASKQTAVQRTLHAYRAAVQQYFRGLLTMSEVGAIRSQWCQACSAEVDRRAHERKAMEMSGFVQHGRDA